MSRSVSVSKSGRIQYPSDFNEFWSLYPKKVKKSHAYSCWLTVTNTVDKSALLIAANRYSDHVRQNFVDVKFVPDCAKWLREHQYSDHLPDTDSVPFVVTGTYENYSDLVHAFIDARNMINESDRQGCETQRWLERMIDYFCIISNGLDGHDDRLLIFRKVDSGAS